MIKEKYSYLPAFVVGMIIIFIVVLSYRGLQAKLSRQIISKPAVAQVPKQADLNRQIIMALIHLRDGEPCSLADDGSVLIVAAYRWNGSSKQRVVYVYVWDGAAWIERWIIPANDAVDRFNKEENFFS